MKYIYVHVMSWSLAAFCPYRANFPPFSDDTVMIRLTAFRKKNGKMNPWKRNGKRREENLQKNLTAQGRLGGLSR